ncbi:ABC transporter permease [Paenibacillus thalictri]|uniref:Sugar ABC transporter permease n=1 Tax=Paenibacillus thalictri TaxID=2527873 RepID=A0A4Q9DUE2_9BACL|nr:ABC transporter permease subunit [Paenibacillus thalictri]TBL80614.1 sugar ABC transporter permease [Paenibacillus thalictri]
MRKQWTIPHAAAGINETARIKRRSKSGTLWTAVKKHRFYYYLILPGIVYFLVFHYLPMLGIVIAFKDISEFDVFHDMLYGEWVGLKHFSMFLESIYFWNVMSNTLLISIYKLLWGFPAPIVLALLVNEARNRLFARVFQTIAYMPHFLSWVVIAGLMMNFFSTQIGFVNGIVRLFGGEPVFFLGSADYFRSLLVGSHVWHTVGWNTILYLAAMTGIDPQLYEAARMDGADKWRQTIHVTLPGIMHVIVILLIFNIGNLLNAGFEQTLLLYSPAVYQVSDIVDTYVYREGITSLHYSYTAAVGLFKNAVALILVLTANYAAKRLNQESLF